jgi:hypothetical protein
MRDDTSAGRDHVTLDAAIDRVVRGMTQVEASEDAVFRVQARVRNASRQAEVRTRAARVWSLTPRAAWTCAATVVLIALTAAYWLSSRQTAHRPIEAPRHASTAQPPPAITHAEPVPPVMSSSPTASKAPNTNARASRRVRAASVASDGYDSSEVWTSDLIVPENAIVMTAIAPALLAIPEPLSVAPLETETLTLKAIPVSPMGVAPIDLERAGGPRE